jgi:rRNA-processing protein FCF1
MIKIIDRKKCTKISDLNYQNEKDHANVDTRLIKIAQSINGVIATMDDSLKSRARRLGIPIIFIRNGRIDCKPHDPELW